MATIGVGSRSPTGLSITEGVAGSVPSERAGIEAILRRSCSSFSALFSTVVADEWGCWFIVAPLSWIRAYVPHTQDTRT